MTMDGSKFLYVFTFLLAFGSVALAAGSYIVGREGMRTNSLEAVEAGRNLSAVAVLIAIVVAGITGYFQSTLLALSWSAITVIIFFWSANCARWLISAKTPPPQ